MNDEPRWLSPKEREAWIGLAAVMTHLPAVLDSQMKAATGLSQFEYLVLARLSEMSGRTVQLKHLAVLANGSLSRLSHVLTRLEERGWLTRHPMPEDGRLTAATLTESGWEKVVMSAPHHLDGVRRNIMDHLSPTQVTQLRSITKSLLATLCVDLGNTTHQGPGKSS